MTITLLDRSGTRTRRLRPDGDVGVHVRLDSRRRAPRHVGATWPVQRHLPGSVRTEWSGSLLGRPDGARNGGRPSPQADEQESPSVAPTSHLTTRGRVVVGALLVLCALLVFSLGRFSAGADASSPTRRVTVQPGDTLWALAQAMAPSSDPRTEVARISAANRLVGGAALTPGSILAIPLG